MAEDKKSALSRRAVMQGVSIAAAAVIKLKPGVKGDDKLKQDIIVFAKSKLAGFKVPRTIDFIEELPRNPAGKVERKKVRSGYWEGRKVQI